MVDMIIWLQFLKIARTDFDDATRDACTCMVCTWMKQLCEWRRDHFVVLEFRPVCDLIDLFFQFLFIVCCILLIIVIFILIFGINIVIIYHELVIFWGKVTIFFRKNCSIYSKIAASIDYIDDLSPHPFVCVCVCKCLRSWTFTRIHTFKPWTHRNRGRPRLERLLFSSFTWPMRALS